MISYTWGVLKERVELLHKKLVAQNISTWRDQEKMGAGNILVQMSGAIDGAGLIVICASKKYMDSQNCQAEVNYAYKMKKQMIFLRLDKNLAKEGWLSMIMGNDLYFDITGDDYEKTLDKVVEEVKKKLPSAALTFEAAKDATSEGHSTKVPGPIPRTSAQKERIFYFQKWTAGEVTQWLNTKDIKYSIPSCLFFSNLNQLVKLIITNLSSNCHLYLILIIAFQNRSMDQCWWTLLKIISEIPNLWKHTKLTTK